MPGPDVVQQYLWEPDAPPPDGEALADRLCRLACLWYQDDGPERRADARALLAAQPSLAGATIWAAATTSDAAAVERWLAQDRALATTRGGPFGWCALGYLAYSRLNASVAAEGVLRSARLLLDAGADPDEGYLWHGLPTPFTLLTGAFGHGELGPDNQPPHPHSIALARMLLDAGANPNDGQTLYNRMFEPDDDHLELLLEYGLGTGDGGPWKARLGAELASPPEMVRDLLHWAVSHDQPHRVQLCVEAGVVDIARRDEDGHTPAELATLTGSTEIAGYLLAHGSPAVALDGTEALVAAIMAGDVARARGFDDALIADLRAQQPWLIVWASARHRVEGVRLLIELGWPVNAYGRGDVPSEMPWQTALHQAAADGELELIELLMAAGADPDLRDDRFGGKPLGWARYGRQDAAVELLVPVTDGD